MKTDTQELQFEQNASFWPSNHIVQFEYILRKNNFLFIRFW